MSDLLEAAKAVVVAWDVMSSPPLSTRINALRTAIAEHEPRERAREAVIAAARREHAKMAEWFAYRVENGGLRKYISFPRGDIKELPLLELDCMAASLAAIPALERQRAWCKSNPRNTAAYGCSPALNAALAEIERLAGEGR